MRRLKSFSLLFWASVIFPTTIAGLYFGLFAEDLYVSESRIIVRSSNEGPPSPLDAAIGAMSLSPTSEESDTVIEFIQSRGALSEINKDSYVLDAYTDQKIFPLDRFGWLRPINIERLHGYFQGKVEVTKGENPSVVRLVVKAYEPDVSQEINERLLVASENLINNLSERSLNDAIAFAEVEVQLAQDRARRASIALSNFKEREGLIDPELQAQVGLQTIAQIQEELSKAQTRYLQLTTYTPRAPQIPFLQTQITQLQNEIDIEKEKLVGGAQSISSSYAQLQDLSLSSDFADRQLSVTLRALQEARSESQRQRAYVERISEPSKPDYPAYPKRIRNILSTLIAGFLSWGIISMLIIGVREHQR